MKFPTLVLGLVGALLLLLPHVHAAQLGVNYYDESLTDDNGQPYIARSIDQVGIDMDNIKSISNNVKFYLNPYVDANLPWVEQLVGQARSRHLHTVVNVMDDHHQLTSDNWDDYANRVVNECRAMNGKTDEFIVGNEITLHSPMSRTEIRDKVTALMDRCDAVFDGQVSYEEFWYANEVWRGTSRPIYFMMYEDINAFHNNMNELTNNFGSKGYIGEWGEDLLDGSNHYDEQWQKDQIRQRWDVIKSSPAPVAYIFTYREPSETSFSMLRPGDDSRRPLWEVFGAPSAPVQETKPAPTQQPAPQPEVKTEQPTTAITEQLTKSEQAEQPMQQSSVAQVTEQPASAKSAKELRAEKRLAAKAAKAAKQKALKEARAAAKAARAAKARAGRSSRVRASTPASPLDQLAVTSTGKLVSSTTDGSCRELSYENAQAKVCQKESGYELYYLGGTEQVCAGSSCVGPANGFASFT